MPQIMCFDTQPESRTNAEAVVGPHGWAGTLDFATAVRVLQQVDIDHQRQEIYMTLDVNDRVSTGGGGDRRWLVWEGGGRARGEISVCVCVLNSTKCS